MKKSLIILAAMFCTTVAKAQFVVYHSVPTPQTTYNAPMLPDPNEEWEARMAARAYANQIVSSETMTVNGFEIFSSRYLPMKVKVIQRRNGEVEISCLGIKKNGYWTTCDKGIASLEGMYDKAKTDSDRRTILSLMEYGNYLLIVNSDNEIYVIE